MTDMADPVEGHTPGPWRVAAFDVEELHTIWSAKDAPIPSILIARTCFAPASEANAALIARAPAMASELALLADPNSVHLNMLRGGIAKPTPAQIGHLYRGEGAVSVVAEVRRQNAEAFAGDEIATLNARVAELEAGLVSIRDMEDRPYEGPHFDRAAVDACPECQRYAGHPIQNGICDEHRRPFYAREKHDAFENEARGYRASSIARSLLSKLEGGN